MKKTFQKIGRPLMFGLFMFTAFVVNAQSNPNSAISNVNQQVRGIFGSAANLLLGIAALVAIVGAIHVFSKWSQGDPNTTKVASNWIAALIFIALAAIIIRAMTGVQ